MTLAEYTKTFLKTTKKKGQLDMMRDCCCCSICGKKLNKFIKRRTSENPLVCWQCMIVDNNNADF